MSKRTVTDAPPDSFVLSGDLKGVLHMHARERANHFFYYLFLMKVLVNRLNAKVPALHLDPAEGVDVAATEQIDTGFRRGDEGRYHAFERDNPDVVATTASDFTRMDAAHTCNLGLAAAFVTRVAAYVSQAAAATDRIPYNCFEALRRVCGHTQQLPQRVNIGPDRVIDVLHGDLAPPMLRALSPKVASYANVVAYRDAAIRRMEEYRAAKAKEGDHGVAACADCYLDVYKDVGVPTRQERRAIHINYQQQVAALLPGQPLPPSPTVPRDPFVESVWRAIRTEAYEACASSRGELNEADYVS